MPVRRAPTSGIPNPPADAVAASAKIVVVPTVSFMAVNLRDRTSTTEIESAAGARSGPM
jgi:hypothetical protein